MDFGEEGHLSLGCGTSSFRAGLLQERKCLFVNTGFLWVIGLFKRRFFIDRRQWLCPHFRRSRWGRLLSRLRFSKQRASRTFSQNHRQRRSRRPPHRRWCRPNQNPIQKRSGSIPSFRREKHPRRTSTRLLPRTSIPDIRPVTPLRLLSKRQHRGGYPREIENGQRSPEIDGNWGDCTSCAARSSTTIAGTSISLRAKRGQPRTILTSNPSPPTIRSFGPKS